MSKSSIKEAIDCLYICGFMATGKSSIGSVLSQKLELPFQDLDRFLERKERTTIPKLFADKGEEYFRKREREYLEELSSSFKGVLALGGGSLQNQEIVDALKERGVLVYIETPIEIIIDRIMRNKNRPIALDKQGKIKTRETLLSELKVLYSNRKIYYNQAQIHIESDGSDCHEEMANRIIEKLKLYV